MAKKEEIEKFKRIKEERKKEGKDKFTDEHVVALTNENFDDQVIKSEDVWYVDFYSPNCP